MALMDRIYSVYTRMNDPQDAQAVQELMRSLLSPLDRQILGLVEDRGPLTSVAVARSVDVLPQNASRSLSTLCKYGFLHRIKETKVYRYSVEVR